MRAFGTPLGDDPDPEEVLEVEVVGVGFPDGGIKLVVVLVGPEPESPFS